MKTPSLCLCAMPSHFCIVNDKNRVTFVTAFIAFILFTVKIMFAENVYFELFAFLKEMKKKTFFPLPANFRRNKECCMDRLLSQNRIIPSFHLTETFKSFDCTATWNSCRLTITNLFPLMKQYEIGEMLEMTNFFLSSKKKRKIEKNICWECWDL